MGLNGAAEDNAVDGLGDRELVGLVGECSEEGALAADFGDEVGEEEKGLAFVIALAADLLLLGTLGLILLLASGGSGGESNCDMEGLVNGLTTVVLETCLLAGGEKEVWTGCGKLGGSET